MYPEVGQLSWLTVRTSELYGISDYTYVSDSTAHYRLTAGVSAIYVSIG